MKPFRFLAAVAALLAFAAPAQPPQGGLRLSGDSNARIAWLRVFASRGDDWINDIVPLSGDRYLAAGFLNRVDDAAPDARAWQALAAVIRADGTVAADRHYGSAGINAFWSAREAANERVALAGFSDQGGAGGIDALAVISRPDGGVEAQRLFGGAGYDRFTSLAPAGDGFVFLGHSQNAGEDRRRLYAVRSDAGLTPVWERIIEGPDSIAPLYIQAASDGGFVVAGGISRGEDADILVLRLDQDGRELWRRTIGTPEASDINHGLALLPNGNIVVVGYSQSWGARGNDILAATLSPTGEVLRREMLGGAEDDRPILAKADEEGRVTIVGHTRSAGAGNADLLIARLDAEGRFEPGVIVMGGPGNDHGTAILPLANGALLVAGYSDAIGRGRQDAFVLRLEGAGWQEANAAFARRGVN